MMSMTMEEREKWFEILEKTGKGREAKLAQRVIPKDYCQYMEQVTREEIQIEVPAVGVPVRCIISRAHDKSENCPVHINLHGGGFIFKQDQDDDWYCAHIAAGIHGIVIDVDYATSDNYAYPVAFEQSYEVVRWVSRHCSDLGADPQRISIGGHSAGGCLAAAISLRAAKEKDIQICLQILDYAANDNYAPLLDEKQERSRALSMLYADGDAELLKNPYVSPAFATSDMMHGLPRALIINAKNCPFCHINESYGMKMIEAGVEVKMRRYINSRHGFTVRLSGEWREAQHLIIREIMDVK